MMPMVTDLAPVLVQGDAMAEGLLAVLVPSMTFVASATVNGEPLNALVGTPLANPFAPMRPDFSWGRGETVFDPLANPALNNFNIVCPDGTSLFVRDNLLPLTGALFLPTTTARWALVLQTQDAASVAIPAVRVVALDTGRLAVNGAPVVAEGISDASGNLTLVVPLNTSYLVLAYVTGAPDRSGASAQTVTPDQQ